MTASDQWYVLIEAGSGYLDGAWELKEKQHVDGDRTAALIRAEVVSGMWAPRGWDAPHVGRLVFELSDTSWLVELSEERWPTDAPKPYTRTIFFRVSVARLFHAKEARPAQPPEKRPGFVRRALGG
ncbi:hypothetical protein [Streptomyces sp. NPDC046939]|uniref:hypothetical protein n=1 Tax=Streptomyces sp. NPDC046939 TaxID=3155376 RepID=UPI0033E2FF55